VGGWVLVILQPLPGSPDGIRLLADRLTTTARRTAAITGVLARLRGGATWVSEAGEAFGARLGEVPPVMDAVSARLGGAAGPLRVLADAMEESQRVVEGAIRDDSDAQATYAALEDRAYALLSAGLGEDSPDVLVVRHLQREQIQVREVAQASHAAACESFREADRRCSATLRALSADALADSGLYRLSAGASTVGRDLASVGSVAAVVPQLKGVAFIGGAIGAVGDTALLVGYDEGSWSDLGKSTALAATGGAGGALKAAGTAGARRTASGVVVTRRLTAQQRLAVGVATQARAKRDAIRARFEALPERGTPSHLLDVLPRRATTTPLWKISREQAVARVRSAAQAKADQAFLDGWRLASANGPQAQKMYAAGATLEVGTTAAAAATNESEPRPGEPAVAKP
jgi:phage gp46-like protein